MMLSTQFGWKITAASVRRILTASLPQWKLCKEPSSSSVDLSSSTAFVASIARRRGLKNSPQAVGGGPYEGHSIEKIERVNHMTKRMGTDLRTLVEKQKAQKAPISGRGKLTENRIKLLTSYYGKAIKANSGDLEGMQSAVWARFVHSLSSDSSDIHNHNLCPAGRSSWCFYQRALAKNVQPRPHSQQLPSNIGEAMKPVYERLGDPQLLRRCRPATF